MRKFISLIIVAVVVAVLLILLFTLGKQETLVEKPVTEKAEGTSIPKKPVVLKSDREVSNEPSQPHKPKKEPKKKVKKREEFKGVVLILEGEVVEEASPVGFAQVYVMFDGVSSQTLCDMEGRFRFSFLLSEKQQKKGIELFLTAVRWWSGFNYGQKKVVVPSEQLMNPSPERTVKVNVKLILNATGELSGRVITVDGSPLEGVLIGIRPTDERGQAFWRPGCPSGAKTDKEGNYRIKNIAPGKYSVSASIKGYLCKEEESNKILGVEVRVEAAKVTRCDFRAHPFNRTKISVVSEEGEPVSGAYCDITIDGRRMSAKTNEEGVCFGFYSESERDSRLRIRCIAAGYEPSVYEAPTLPESVRIILRKGGEVLEGIVCDEGGNPVSGILLLLWDENYSTECGEAKTGKDGRFCFSGLTKEHRYSVLLPNLIGYEVDSSKLEGLSPGRKVRVVLTQVEAETAEERVLLRIMRRLNTVLDVGAMNLLEQDKEEVKLCAEKIEKFLESGFDEEAENFFEENSQKMSAEELKRLDMFIEHLKKVLTNTAEFLRQFSE